MLNTVLEQFFNGLTLGAIYALIALGYTLVYGILLMINFAHSEIFMIGAFAGCGALVAFATLPTPLGLALAFICAMLACGLVAVGEDESVLAAVFCGKGADFPNYVAEWSGPIGLVVALLGEARRRQWAQHVLVPPGGF